MSSEDAARRAAVRAEYLELVSGYVEEVSESLGRNIYMATFDVDGQPFVLALCPGLELAQNVCSSDQQRNRLGPPLVWVETAPDVWSAGVGRSLYRVTLWSAEEFLLPVAEAQSHAEPRTDPAEGEEAGECSGR